MRISTASQSRFLLKQDIQAPFVAIDLGQSETLKDRRGYADKEYVVCTSPMTA